MAMPKIALSKRLVAFLLTMVMVLTLFPVVSFDANARENFTAQGKVSDPPTINDWQKYFGLSTPGGVTTENAGKVWGDKSVFTDTTSFGNQTVQLTDPDNFLVALSAIASNKTIVGYSTIPTDTVLVLDLSNSMSSADLTSMITATNDAIERLLELNRNNRVGVVVYSGTENWSDQFTFANSCKVLLPIDRYTGVSYNSGNETKYRFVQYSGGDYSVVRGVKNSDNENVSASMEVGGATYMQAGLYAAWGEFNKITDTTVNTGVQKDEKRMPVVVLMSDGAPTVATTQFNNVGTNNRGNGTASSANAANAFLTQLTMSWLRGKLVDKYDNDVLFYTLGLGVGADDIAKSVLDPENTSVSAINGYWETYLDPQNATGNTITMGSGGSRFSVVKDANVTTQHFVDEYFAASNSAGLISAFDLIVKHIILQSKYYPTYVSNGEHALDGYISFNDELGEYMEVKEIKGIIAEGKTYSGAALANAVVKGSFGNVAGGDLSAVNEKGLQVIKAVEKRLGCTERQALDLLEAALKTGQVSYNGPTDYSNYLGWYADENGKYIGFWDGNGTANAPANAKYANRSYGFLGEVGSADNHDQTDMLYIAVQVHKEIATGHETVIYKVPASLVPMVTYSISFDGEVLDENSRNLKMTVTEKEPIRLVYETGLRSDINELNIKDKIPTTGNNAYEYVENGVYTFYTNMFGDESHLDPEDHDATWIDFQPSLENENYYYMDHEVVYDANYNPVTSDPENMSGPFYHRIARVRLTGNGDNAEFYYEYEAISPLTIGSAEYDGENWVIPEGTPFRDVDSSLRVNKLDNKTQTLSYANYPLTPAVLSGYTGSYTVYSYLGNNGKFTVVPAQGIVISKQCDYIPAEGTKFEFVINLEAPAGSTLAEEYPITTVSASGEHTVGTARVNVADQIVVYIEADECVYITGLETGVKYTVNEIVVGKDYRVKSINGVAGSLVAYSGTVSEHDIHSINYVNTLRTQGNLVVTKYVEHPFGNGAPSALFDKEFNVNVDLGEAHAGHTVKVDGVDTVVGNDGVISFKIKAHQSVIISEIETGTDYTVTETGLTAGFTLSGESSKTYGLTGTIAQDANRYAVLTNVYRPFPAMLDDIVVFGIKELEGREWLNTDEFEFQLQRFNGVNWDVVATDMADKPVATGADKRIVFTNTIRGLEFDKAGVYQFRIIELRDNVGGVTYDHTERHFSFIVTDEDVDGKYEVSEIKVTEPVEYYISNGTHYVEFKFNNKYAPLGNAAIQIEITKTLKDLANTGILPEGFKFGLYDGQTLVAESTVTDQVGKAALRMVYAATLLKPETGNIPELELNYVLKEIIPDALPAGMIYDTTEYPVKVFIKDNLDGSISATVKVGTKATPAITDKDYASFENEYKLSPVTDTSISGTKNLENAPIKANTFKFTLKNEDGSDRESVFCNTDGSFAFSAITYDKVGTYRYKIVEENTGISNIVYDTTVYDVVVVVSDAGNGTLVAQRTITKSGENTPSAVTFTNTVNGTQTELFINVDKTVDNRTQEAVSEQGFAFLLYENGTLLDTKYTDANGKAQFKLQFNKVNVGNTYTYKVIERNDAVSGFTYSTKEYTYVVSVEYDADYNVIATVEGVATTDLDAQFTNIYELEGATVNLSGKKTFDLTLGGEDFSFALKDATGATLQTVKNRADGTYAFAPLGFNKTGTYVYTISEVSDGRSGVKFDNTVYDVTVLVTIGQNGKLAADVTFKDGNMDVASPDFNNDFDPTAVNVVINVEKTVENKSKETVGLNGFEFVLKDETGKVVDTVKTDADGKASITLNFDEDDAGEQFVYVLSEVDAGVSGFTYSTKEYRYVVNVLIDENYQLSTKVNSEEVSSVKAEYVNVYELESAKVSLGGTKKFDYTLLKDAFSFELKDEEGKLVENVKNNVDGKFEFTTLEFDKTGTYKYTISEVDGGIESITYDDDVYNVVITVTVGENGKLVADVATTVNNNTEKVEVEFDNKFTPDEVVFEIVIQKYIENLTQENVSPKDFEFVLVDSEGKTVGTFKTGDNGRATVRLKYGKEDADKTYTYKLSEVDTAVPGYEYSDKVYEYTVKITVDDEYNLVAEVMKDGTAAGAISEAVFTNLYEGLDPPPQTGADIGLVYWVPVMLISGGAFIGTVLFTGEKKKANR